MADCFAATAASSATIEMTLRRIIARIILVIDTVAIIGGDGFLTPIGARDSLVIAGFNHVRQRKLVNPSEESPDHAERNQSAMVEVIERQFPIDADVVFAGCIDRLGIGCTVFWVSILCKRSIFAQGPSSSYSFPQFAMDLNLIDRRRLLPCQESHPDHWNVLPG